MSLKVPRHLTAVRTSAIAPRPALKPLCDNSHVILPLAHPWPRYKESNTNPCLHLIAFDLTHADRPLYDNHLPKLEAGAPGCFDGQVTSSPEPQSFTRSYLQSFSPLVYFVAT